MKKYLFLILTLMIVISAIVVPSVALAQGESSWEADDSSTYNQIRSTLSHYIFNDNFENVPFGSGWVDMIASIFAITYALIPYVVSLIVVVILIKCFTR